MNNKLSFEDLEKVTGGAGGVHIYKKSTMLGERVTSVRKTRAGKNRNDSFVFHYLNARGTEMHVRNVPKKSLNAAERENLREILKESGYTDNYINSLFSK